MSHSPGGLGPSVSAPRTNPVSLRLWKIISTASPGGFDDPPSREALEIVSERYCGARVADSGRGRKKRARRDRGAHWLGSDAVRRAGLAEAGAKDEAPDHASSDSEEEDTEEDWDDGDGDGDGDGDARSVTPASSIRPGILSRNHSSTTSIRSAQAATTTTTPSTVTGATHAKRYFKRDLEAGLVAGSLRFLTAFEKVDEVSLARAGAHDQERSNAHARLLACLLACLRARSNSKSCARICTRCKGGANPCRPRWTRRMPGRAGS